MESLKALHIIFNSVYDAIFIHDRDGRIYDLNNMALELFGISREEALNLRLAPDLSSPESSLEDFRLIWESVLAGEPQLFEWKARRPHLDECFDVEIFLHMVSLNEKETVLATVRDITARKESERALHKSKAELLVNHEKLKMLHQQMEKKSLEIEAAYAELKTSQATILQQEKMASIGQLAAGVAHEINNPMGFISSNLGTLAKYLERLMEFMAVASAAVTRMQDSAEAKEVETARARLKIDYICTDAGELIRESLDGAERVKKIVQDLKGFSRVDETEAKPANINDCLESTLNIVWNELKYKATVRKELGDLPLVVCNPGQLNQVFMNMLVNAAHSIEKQGEITLKSWCQDDIVCISISDTGCGIPPEVKRRIFEPFFTTKEVGKGTGLGLAITYDIIKKHQGEIVVDSEVGKGTTFTIKIPLSAGEQKAA